MADRAASSTAHRYKAPGQLLSALQRPLRFLFLSPVVMATAVLIVLQSGTQNLIFASLGEVFQQEYNFSVSISGVVYIGVTVGFVLAALVFAKTSDRLSASIASRRNNSILQPEYRIIFTAIGLPQITAGLIWYGWSMQAHVLWVSAVFGLALIGSGLTTVQVRGVQQRV